MAVDASRLANMQEGTSSVVALLGPAANPNESTVRALVSGCRHKLEMQVRLDARELGSSTAPLEETSKVSAEFGTLEKKAAVLFGQFEEFFADYGIAMEHRNELLGR